MMRVAILISGRGSNLRSIAEAGLPLEIVAVISNNPAAAGLQYAAERGIKTLALDHHNYPTREAFDQQLSIHLDALAPDLIVLAGYMRILSDAFVARYHKSLINIHPSLLPAYPGLHTHRRALADGVKIHGCTVHFVTPQLDAGPIVIQAAVPVLSGDDEATLAARVLAAEHRIYPAALRWLATGRINYAQHISLPGVEQSEQWLCVPPLL